MLPSMRTARKPYFTNALATLQNMVLPPAANRHPGRPTKLDENKERIAILANQHAWKPGKIGYLSFSFSAVSPRAGR